MAITYTWKIKSMLRQQDTGFVTNVTYEITGTDGTKTGRAPGFINFTAPADLTKIKAYDSLTEADVLAWVQASVPAARVTMMETMIASQINTPAPPVMVSGTPWSN